MKLLRVVTSFDGKDSLVGRQTNFIKLDDFDLGEKVEVLLKGKEAKKITIDIVDCNDYSTNSARVTKRKTDK